MSDVYDRLAEMDNPEEVIQIARDLSRLPKDAFKKIVVLIERLSEQDPAAVKITDQLNHGEIDAPEAFRLMGQL